MAEWRCMEEWDDDHDKPKEANVIAQPNQEHKTPQTIPHHEKKQEEWRIVGTKHTTAEEVKQRFHMVGVKLVRVGKRGETLYHPQDIIQFFKEVTRIDPKVIILNHKKEANSAKTANEMATGPSMDYTKFLDLRTDGWGGPSEQRSRTMWMFYVASDYITPSLHVLRNDNRINQYLLNGGYQCNSLNC